MPGLPPFSRHAPALARLAGAGVWLGTSSWKYPGWAGQLYHEQRYLTRGRFSRPRFEQECLREYADTFRTVCVDAGFYRFPDPRFVDKLAGDVPEGFRFSWKVTEDITTRRFPRLARHGDKAGKENPHFLDADLFERGFLRPLGPHRNKTGLLIFEFTRFRRDDFARGRDFLDGLDAFLGNLPNGWDYGIELRNQSLLRDEYFEVLRRHGVGHVYNQWQRMPDAGDQWAAHPPDLAASPAGARLLLKRGRAYAEAVKAFEPYDRVQEIQENVRDAARLMVGEALSQAKARQTRPLYLYVNNRLEGNALGTIEAVLDHG